MLPAAGVAQFVASPVGRYLAGERFLAWCRDPQLFGCVYWGQLTRDDAQVVVRMLEAELNPVLHPHHSLADLRRIESASPEAFEVLARYLGSRWDALNASICRQAILRPQGMIGSVVAGFYSLHTPSYPAQSFARPEEALDWLGLEGGPALLAEVDGLYASVVKTPEIVRELRNAVSFRLPRPSIAQVAAELRVSIRTLQRRLGEAGTSFNQELTDHRIRTAQRLLRESDATLTEVAYDVGCSSLQHFSVLFRKATGESPRAWRARSRERTG